MNKMAPEVMGDLRGAMIVVATYKALGGLQ